MTPAELRAQLRPKGAEPALPDTSRAVSGKLVVMGPSNYHGPDGRGSTPRGMPGIPRFRDIPAKREGLPEFPELRHPGCSPRLPLYDRRTGNGTPQTPHDAMDAALGVEAANRMKDESVARLDGVPLPTRTQAEDDGPSYDQQVADYDRQVRARVLSRIPADATGIPPCVRGPISDRPAFLAALNADAERAERAERVVMAVERTTPLVEVIPTGRPLEVHARLIPQSTPTNRCHHGERYIFLMDPVSGETERRHFGGRSEVLGICDPKGGSL